MFWEAGTPFGLTSLKLIVLLATVGLTSIFILLRRTGCQEQVAARRWVNPLLYGLGITMPVFALLFFYNRSLGFYPSFAELAEQIAVLST